MPPNRFTPLSSHYWVVGPERTAFLDGHVHAFEQLGGTPIDQIRYDNLKSAV